MAADLRASIEACSEFDLWDRICEASEFYEGVDARPPALRRGRLSDAMLSREKPADPAGPRSLAEGLCESSMAATEHPRKRNSLTAACGRSS